MQLLVHLGARPRDLGDAAVRSAASPRQARGRTAPARGVCRRRGAGAVLRAEVARGVVGHFVAAFRSGARYHQSTFLLGAAGPAGVPVVRADARGASIPEEGLA